MKFLFLINLNKMLTNLTNLNNRARSETNLKRKDDDKIYQEMKHIYLSLSTHI